MGRPQIPNQRPGHPSETGLYYDRARHYDPTVGRFIGEDPIGFEGSNDFYGLREQWAGTFEDPSGLKIAWNGYAISNAHVRSNFSD